MLGIKGIDNKNLTVEFKYYYEKYYPTVFRHALYLTANVQAAEDLTQEAFLRLYKEPPKHSNVGAWLIKVATNLAYNLLRGEKTKNEKVPQIAKEDETTAISSEDTAIRNFEIARTRKILDAMPARDRMCLLLKFSGYKYKEISEALQIEIHSIGTIIARAQSKFKELYLKEEKRNEMSRCWNVSSVYR